MSGTPKRDEQGTRDRPYDLIVDFDPTKIDGLLAALGLKSWSAQRPGLGVFVEMEQGGRQFMVTSDGKQSDLQRESLSAAAAKRGMAIVLPDAATLEKANVSAAELMVTPSEKAGRTSGKSVASPSMKPSGAGLAARRRFSRGMAIRNDGRLRVRDGIDRSGRGPAWYKGLPSRGARP